MTLILLFATIFTPDNFFSICSFSVLVKEVNSRKLIIYLRDMHFDVFNNKMIRLHAEKATQFYSEKEGSSPYILLCCCC